MKRVSTLVLALAAGVMCAAPRAAAQDPTPGQRAAAAELLEAMQISAALDASINTMMEVQIQATPALREVEGVMRDFFRRYMGWEAMKDQYAEIYARAFTEAELREYTAFYRTPAGRKLAGATPQLMREGAALGERTVQEHMGELQQMILEHLTTRRDEGTAPKPGQPAKPNGQGT